MGDRSAQADLLLVNARVLTLDPGQPRATAVAIAGDRISEVLQDPAQVRAARVVDLRGAVLLPGFHDAHNHMAWFGMSLSEVDLRSPGVSSLSQLYAAIAERAAATGPGDWVVGAGYDQNKVGGHPHRDALDRAAPGRRVWLRHTSGHMCVVSSPVLADLGMDASPARVPGGRVAADAAGRPTGLLEERAQQLVGELVHPTRSPRWPTPSTGPESGTSPRASPAAPRPASAAAGSARAPSSWPPTRRPGIRAGSGSASS